MNMSFYRAFYHLVWATKYRSALLIEETEVFAYEVIRSKAVQLQVMVFALNGTTDHVHLVASIPPSIAVGEVVKQVKGITSFRLNQSGNRSTPFVWQSGFSMFTFDEKRLPNYIRYVERQKEHHATNNLIPILERLDEFASYKMREIPPPYSGNDRDWWDEMALLS